MRSNRNGNLIVENCDDDHTYQKIQASQTNVSIANGVQGDYLKRIIINVTAGGVGALLTLFDGNTPLITSPLLGFPTNGPIQIDVGVRCGIGGWKITTGAGLNVVAIGDFQ